MKNNVLFPVFIVSKNRAERCITARELERSHVPYRIIVEQSDLQSYIDAGHDPEILLVLPQSYLDDYDTYWDRSRTQGRTGPGPARNFAWDLSISEGHSHHWVMDDNIEGFYRMNRNVKDRSFTPAIFRAMEDFSLRYDNLAISGPNYEKFCKAVDKVPPFVQNTRIYSCLLIRNDIPYRWRGTYNEDTDLSLRVLKDGWTTVQFNAFLQGKVTTQRMRGGNSEEFYDEDGTKDKSQMLEDMHPDVAKMVWKFNRWHHQVDYKGFVTPLRFRHDYNPIKGVNEYGMKRVTRPKPKRDK